MKNLKRKHGKKNIDVIKLSSLCSVRNNSSVDNQSCEKYNLKLIFSERELIDYSNECIFAS